MEIAVFTGCLYVKYYSYLYSIPDRMTYSTFIQVVIHFDGYFYLTEYFFPVNFAARCHLNSVFLKRKV